MKHLISFAFGAVLGVCGTLYAVHERVVAQAVQPAPLSGATPSPRVLATEAGATPWPLPSGVALRPLPAAVSAPAAAAPAALVGRLLQQLAADPDPPFNSPASRDLACLMRQDPRVAGQVRDRLLNSASDTERHSLMRLLAQDDSPETTRLVGQLLSGPDGQAKRLGFDLLRTLDSPGARPELTRALLVATQQEKNPEYLADLIATLGNQPLDPTSKGVVVQQLQTLLAQGPQPVRASALMGLGQLADPPTLAWLVKGHLHDPDPAVRLASINVALRLDARELDPGFLNVVHRLSLASDEPEAVRNLASALLARHQPQPGR
jgi:hypothetical protein